MATKAAEDTSFLEDLAGQGLESITANEQAIPYLGMVQPDGTAAAAFGRTCSYRSRTHRPGPGFHPRRCPP